MRGTTRLQCCLVRPSYYFYPRTPCGVRHDRRAADHGHQDFYPRTPCGVRHELEDAVDCGRIFLSTYPVRGTTAAWPRLTTSSEYFYPRTPCGVRLPRYLQGIPTSMIFLSTYPVRGTTSSGSSWTTLRTNFYPRTPCGVRQRTP